MEIREGTGITPDNFNSEVRNLDEKKIRFCPYGFPTGEWMRACGRCKSDGRFENCPKGRYEAPLEAGGMTHNPCLVYGRMDNFRNWLKIWQSLPYTYTAADGTVKQTYVRVREFGFFDFMCKREIAEQVQQDLNSFDLTAESWSGSHHRGIKMGAAMGLLRLVFHLLGFKAPPKPRRSEIYPADYRVGILQGAPDVSQTPRRVLWGLWCEQKIVDPWLWIKPLGCKTDFIDEGGAEWT